MNKKVIRNLEKHTKQLSKIGLTINSLLESNDKNFYYEIQIKDLNVISKIDDLDAISDNKPMLMLYSTLKYLSNKYNDNEITIDDDYCSKSILGVTEGMLIDIKNNLSKTGVVKIKNNDYIVLDNVEFESDYTRYNVSEKYYVYRFLSKNSIIYVGRSTNVHNRMKQHFGGKGHLPKQVYDLVNKIEYCVLDSEISMIIAELFFINKWKPIYNTADIYRGEIYLQEFEDLEWIEYDINQ